MRRYALVTLSALAVVALIPACAAAFAAEIFEYGNPRELKTIKALYIDAGEDLDLRDILKSRVEQIPGVKVVDRPEDAEHWVVFRWSGSHPFWARTIVLAGPTTPHPKLLFTDRTSESELVNVADDAGKALVKAYRRAAEK